MTPWSRRFALFLAEIMGWGIRATPFVGAPRAFCRRKISHLGWRRRRFEAWGQPVFQPYPHPKKKCQRFCMRPKYGVVGRGGERGWGDKIKEEREGCMQKIPRTDRAVGRVESCDWVFHSPAPPGQTQQAGFGVGSPAYFFD